MAAKKGRKAGFVMGDEHRTKIANSKILKSLIEHAEGKRELSASQVSAGLGLLRKVLPDLAQVTHTGDGDKEPIRHAIELRIVDPR